MTNTIKAAILIVFYNDLQHLKRLSDSLQKQTEKDFSVYVLDNNKKGINHCDEFRKVYPGFIEMTHPDNLGFAGGNNFLARQAIKDGCKYLWVLNPDMEPEPETLNALMEYFDHNPECGAVGPALLFGDSKTHPRLQLFGGEVNFKSQKKNTYFSGQMLKDVSLPSHKLVSMINAGSMLIRSVLVDRIGLFEEMYFMYNDEIDIMRRIRDTQYNVYVISNAIVWHHHDWSPQNHRGYHVMYYYMIRNKYLYYYKFCDARTILFGALVDLIKLPLVLKFCVRTSGFKLLYYYYLGLFHGLLNRKGKSKVAF